MIDLKQTDETGKRLLEKLCLLQDEIQKAVIRRVVNDFIDTLSPLRNFTECLMVCPQNEELFKQTATALENFSARAAKTAKLVAAGGCGDQKKLSENILSSSVQV